ncbi:Heat shock protein DnaJ N-terminal [Penicillium paradoxum]|uniref:Heat shock protein DnaJ N-terminal n=1 Tax=Penicillium paradoxum TaxID=176176 RepID=UPI0025471F7E|nr:Heat shock protein DnaJ N-terminal [Penicillium paradoxum]KAJ5787978.1 Heat shock protein DnaJ N-terminal [Penicillium paradoxum]
MSTVHFSIDAYAILGVERDARITEINAAYKRLALKHHPDKAGNADATIERFQQVQDAVEILRDPERRALLDSRLNENGRRSRAPSNHYNDFNVYNDYSAQSYEKTYRRPFRRERRQGHFNWPQYQRSHTVFDDEFACYMRSFGSSVHMDPDSADSKAKRAQFQADYAEWEKEWADIDPEMQRARAELRKEKMRARMKRDVEEAMGDLNGDTSYAEIIDRVVAEGLEGLNFGAGTNFEDFTEPEDLTCNPADTFNQSAYEFAKASAQNDKDQIHLNRNSSSRSTASPQSTRSNSSTGNSSTNASTANDSHFTTQHPTSNPTADAFKTTVEAFNTAAEAFKEVTQEADAAVDQVQNSAQLESDLMIPLVPYFNQKLADPHGRYKLADYTAEMNGILLEIYCGWLEEARLSIPFAKPVNTQTDPKLCSHLGLWHKEYCRPNCEACNFWMPIFLLTCPGCGVKACVRCKFAIVSSNQ